MSFWLQHGHGKADRIARLAAEGALDGVILSPAHEGAKSLAQTAADVRAAGLPVAVDPQTYVYSIAGASAREHKEHGLEFPQIHWSVDPAAIEAHVQAALDANTTIGATGPFIAPSVLQRGFRDAWAVTAIQYARVSERLATGQDVLASLVIEDSALGNWADIEEWLDVATTLQLAGFYVVVARDTTTYPAVWEGQRVANLMRLTYRLTQLNGYRVLLGYADFDALGIVAAGAEGLASGWHYGLRVFRSDRWLPGGYGRQPIPRVLSLPLLTPIEARGEAEQILGTALAATVLPYPGIRTFLAGGVGRWTNSDGHLHHLSELSRAVRGVAALTDTATRLTAVETAVAEAVSLLDQIDAARVPVSPGYRPRLEAMRTGLSLFRRAEGV